MIKKYIKKIFIHFLVKIEPYDKEIFIDKKVRKARHALLSLNKKWIKIKK
uniref:Ribosomal protein L22 n=1 Tax=Genista tridentata subsp. tridentata TaxID=2942621 RepID=A0A976U5W3_9FABA|nr:ribosomal protein L22 [Genista tridentata subsp. tridentata]